MKKAVPLLIAILLIIGGIIFLEGYSSKSGPGSSPIVEIIADNAGMEVEEKEKMYRRAKEITTPDAFINTDAITVEELVGDKVVLIDFWTYSCINCQRTTPYLNAWHDKYEDDGLVIIGVHTPEFEFEKDLANVQTAVDRFEIEYPVVLDNDYSTWRAYQNRFWPRKYLIDVDGFVVYDHIGEGAYEETERIIQELLQERADRLALEQEIDRDIAEINGETKHTSKTPEVYFGSSRNELLANGKKFTSGVQQFEVPEDLQPNKIYLEGEWDITDEYATNLSENARILLPYEASDVFTVASAEPMVRINVTRDEEALNEAAGSDILNDGSDYVEVSANQLYKLIEADEPGKFLLEMTITQPGLKIYTFTFG